MVSTASPASNLLNRFNWARLYILRPLGQIFLFVAGSSLIIIVVALVLGLLISTAQQGPLVNILPVLKVPARIDLFQQIIRQLPNTILNGITIGFVYAMIAVGYTMVYGVLKFVNFAHSEIFMVGGFVGYEVMVAFSRAGTLTDLNPVLLIIAMILVAMVVCGLLAVTIERLAYKPLRRAPRLVPLISAIGVSFFLQDFMRGYAALLHNQFNLAYLNDSVPFLKQKFPLTFVKDIFPTTLPVSVGMDSIVVIVGAILMVVALNYFVNGTRIGKGIRAVSQDQTTASLMGINVDMMITLTFLIGGAFGGAAGVLFGIKTTRVNAYVGFAPGLKAFTAAVLGGIGNITGALIGGILLGLIESFFASILPFLPALGLGYTDIFAFGILIMVLVFRPTGLLGKKVDEKV
ncbi:MAG: branched-chain amino acid ABC transporter permease [Anaerolineae bacterium]|nr:branched-chain amino acid ABC transporter permease [Anaerolineae bacterium]